MGFAYSDEVNSRVGKIVRYSSLQFAANGICALNETLFSDNFLNVFYPMSSLEISTQSWWIIYAT